MKQKKANVALNARVNLMDLANAHKYLLETCRYQAHNRSDLIYQAISTIADLAPEPITTLHDAIDYLASWGIKPSSLNAQNRLGKTLIKHLAEEAEELEHTSAVRNPHSKLTKALEAFNEITKTNKPKDTD